MRVHPVFHISHLVPVAENPLPGQVQPNLPPIIVNGEEEFEVDEILDSRLRYRKLEYLVKWIGEYNPTWEPFINLENSPDVVQSFHEQYLTKPGP